MNEFRYTSYAQEIIFGPGSVSIILPHAMCFNLDVTTPQLAPAAEAMGITLTNRSAEDAVAEAIQRIDALIGQMNLSEEAFI